MVAFGPRNYFRENWNRFDFVVVFVSLGQACIEGFMGINFIPGADSLTKLKLFDAKALRVLRVVRLVRIVRILKGFAK